MPWIPLCELSALEEGKGKFVAAGGREFAVYKVGEKIHVMDNVCPHAGGDLSGGMIQDGCVYCPWHWWAFGLEDGKMPNYPEVKVDVFQTRIAQHDGQPPMVEIDLPEKKVES